MQIKAVFLDRDGTINVEKGYLYKKEDFDFIEGTQEAIKLLNDNGYKVIVITNQSGIARGFYNELDMKKLHLHIDSLLASYGARIDAYFYCPHHPDFTGDCDCRKPKPGLLFRAAKIYGIDLENSYLVGDKESDIRCAENATVNGVLVGAGKQYRNLYDFVSRGLLCQ